MTTNPNRPTPPAETAKETTHTADARRVNVVFDSCNEDGEIDVCLQREGDVGYFAIIPGTTGLETDDDGCVGPDLAEQMRATPEYATGLLFSQALAMLEALYITSNCSPVKRDLDAMPDDAEITLTFTAADLKQIRAVVAAAAVEGR